MSIDPTGYGDLYKNQGYWRVGESVYPTKIQAILAAQEQDTWPTFHYNDSYWDEFDWSTEPNETLEELYLQRAHQLRDRYKTLILRYSGGGDSYNILKTFLDNGIKLDLVVVNEYYEEENLDRVTEPGSQEKLKVAYPTLEKLKSEGHDFEWMTVDLSRFYMLPRKSRNWWREINAPRLRGIEIAAPRVVQHPALEKYDNPETAIILGLDKPFVRKTNNIWTVVIGDSLPCQIPSPTMSRIIPEPFYWTADLPALPCKQAHVFKQFLKEHGKGDRYDGWNLDAKHNKKIAYALLYSRSHGMKLGDEIPYWQDPVSATFKNNGAYNPNSDAWLLDSKAGKAWVRGVEAADKAIHSRYKYDQGSMMDQGLVQLYTTPRWIGK